MSAHHSTTVAKLKTAAQQLAEFLYRHKGYTTFFTGAGFSTASGIPDYRGENGVYTRNPNYKVIYYQEFMRSEEARQRYWARSFFGYVPMRSARPNIGHYTLTRLQRDGWLSSLGGVTQNVDGLHNMAGTVGTVELHGALREVICTECNHIISRDQMQLWLEEMNPDWAETLRRLEHIANGDPTKRNAAWHTTPDGDVEVAAILGVQPSTHHQELTSGRRTSPTGERLLHTAFRYPSCMHCGGIYKPNVVFFGESIHRRVRDAADKTLCESDALLVMGTSLAVGSAARIVRNAKLPNGRHQRPREIAMINLGATRGDTWVDLRLNAPCADLLTQVYALLRGADTMPVQQERSEM